MKISKQTRVVLENFGSIYNSMVFHKGKVQRTNNPSKSMLVEATLEEDFPQEFAIYDVAQFLNVLSVFNEPDLDFTKDEIVITENKKKIVYRFCSRDLIDRKLIPLDKNLKLPSVDIDFTLDKVVYAQLVSAIRVLNLSHISISGDGETLSLRSASPQDKDSKINEVSFDIGETDKHFNMIINLDNLKILPHTYKVNVSKAGLAKFTSQDMELVYSLPLEKSSKFSETKDSKLKEAVA